MFRPLYVAIISLLKNRSQEIHEQVMKFIPLVTERLEPNVVRVIETDLYITMHYIYILYLM